MKYLDRFFIPIRIKITLKIYLILTKKYVENNSIFATNNYIQSYHDKIIREKRTFYRTY